MCIFLSIPKSKAGLILPCPVVVLGGSRILNVDVLHSWQGEQQSKTEGTWLKKAAGTLSWWCRGAHWSGTMTFLQVGEYKFWKDKAVGAKRTKLLEKKMKRPQVKAPWEKPYLEDKVPGVDFHLYQHMNRNHNALPVHKGLQKLLKPNAHQFSHHCQSCPSLYTYCIQSQFSHDTAVQCVSWIKCYMLMQVTKQLDLFWMNQGNLCLDENDTLRRETKPQNFCTLLILVLSRTSLYNA